MRHNLLISGGWAHDFGQTAPMLANIIDTGGVEEIRTTVTTELSETEERLRERQWDLISVYACWFRMLDSRYNESQRERWSRSCSQSLRDLLAGYRLRGTPLFALHTAPICFDDWPAWGTWMGGTWEWGQSFHPSPAVLTMRTTTVHPIVKGLGSFRIRDERYSRLSVAPASVVHLVSEADDRTSSDEPALWTNSAGLGRVVYDALGHDTESLSNDQHQTLIRRSIAWLCGKSDAEVGSI